MKVLTYTPRPAGAILVPALAVFGTPDWAAAQPTEEQVAAIRSACRSDYMSYCWSVPRGGAEALQCLKKDVASLPGPCQQAVKAATATAAAPAGSGTAANAAKPATETKPAAAAAEPATSSSPAETEEAATSAPAGAASAAAAAPTQNGATNTAMPAEQSAPASNAKARRRRRLLASSRRARNLCSGSCRDDFNAHCPGVGVGGGRAISCLEDNMVSLAPQCCDALVKLVR